MNMVLLLNMVLAPSSTTRLPELNIYEMSVKECGWGMKRRLHDKR